MSVVHVAGFGGGSLFYANISVKAKEAAVRNGSLEVAVDDSEPKSTR